MKRVLSILLAVIMLLTSIPLMGHDSIFVTKAKAATAKSESELKAIAQTKGNVSAWEYADYDGNGKSEAFAVITDTQQTILKTIFISYDGYVTTVESNLGLSLYTSDDGNVRFKDGKGFFWADMGAYGSSWKTILYSVKSGQPYKLQLSSKIQGFYEENNKIYTYENELPSSGGHSYTKIELVYNAKTQEFSKGSTIEENEPDEIPPILSISSMSVGDIVTFGSYPQSDVTKSMGSALTAAAPSTILWNSYNYYADSTQSDYMKYYDLTYNGERYRGVYFTKYRPYHWHDSSLKRTTYQDDNGYDTNKIYWFKYEPLKWRILDPVTGYVMCETIIDSQAFNNELYSLEADPDYVNPASYSDKTCQHYLNNWEYSAIRQWLNEAFYKTAFTSNEKKQILCTKLTTPAYKADSSAFDVGETTDYIFLPSYHDMLNTSYGFSSNRYEEDINRRAHASDYAKSQGVYVYRNSSYLDKDGEYPSYYRLRSAGYSSHVTTYVHHNGYDHQDSITTNTNYGIRPAMCFNQNVDDFSIAVFSTEKSLCMKTGDKMFLGFGLLNNKTGLFEGDWRKMAVTVSDPTIVSLSSYEETENGYSLELISKKEGSTNVTITDTVSNTSTSITISVRDSFVKTYSYAIEDMKKFYPNNKWEDHILTNIYDLNGIYINNYTCKKTENGYTVNFDAYNSKYYAGAVDIYDANGLWIGYKEIKKFSDITSIKSSIVQGSYLIYNGITALVPNGKESNLLTYEQESFSKKTPNIELEIPEGGYFTISNNVFLSPGTLTINALEILFDGVYTFLDLATSDSIKNTALSGFKDSASKSISERIKEVKKDALKSEIAKRQQEVMLSTMQSEIEKITEDFSKSMLVDKFLSADDACAGFANIAENILGAYDLNWRHLLSLSLDLGESLFIENIGIVGIALKGCFALTKSTNKLLMAIQMASSTKNPYVTVYSKIEEGFINRHGVIINTEGNVDNEAVLQVFKIPHDDTIEQIMNGNEDSSKNCELYNISFVKNDKLVQPNGKVKVYIPIPEGMNGNTCKVYRQESNGSWTALNARIEDNYLVFETDHFSLYAVVGDEYELTIKSLPNKLNYNKNELFDSTGLELEMNGNLISSGYTCILKESKKDGRITVVVSYGKASTEFEIFIMTSHDHVTDFELGDVNCDGVVKANDARTALRAAAKLEKLDETAQKAADIDGNGKVTAAEARKILRFAAKLDKELK